MPWLRRHEIGRRPPRRAENGMIMAVWCIGWSGVRAEPINTIKRQESNLETAEKVFTNNFT
jgi:hypothetical protein